MQASIPSRQSECRRHRFPMTPGPGDTIYTPRCVHLGNRFIVEFRSTRLPGGCVDYVEDLPNGDLICESHSFWEDVPAFGLPSVDALWNQLEERMREGNGPQE